MTEKPARAQHNARLTIDRLPQPWSIRRKNMLNTNTESSKRMMIVRRSGLWLCLLALPAAAQWRTGYFMQREAGAQTAATIPWSKYTHVIHYALRPTFNNGVCGLDSSNGQLSDANINDFVKAAHAAGVKAIIGIVEDDSHQAINACTTPWNIAQFATRISDFVAKDQYDGVDIAWETGVVAPQYEDLIRRLRTAMPSASLSVRVRIDQRYMTAAVQNELDQINIIAYDLDSTNLSGAPMTHAWYNSATLQGTNTQDIAMDVLWRDFVSAGNASNKLGIGVPFYGRLKQACVDSYRTLGLTDPNQSWLGDVSNHIIPYRDLVNSAYWISGTRIWDEPRQSQYIRYQGGNCSTDAFIPYTGPEQLQAVAAQIRDAHLGGIMTYGLPFEYMSAQLGDARYPLSAAIYVALLTVSTSSSLYAQSHVADRTPVAISSQSIGGTNADSTPTRQSQLNGTRAALASPTTSAAAAPDQIFTYYVDPVSGSDSNPGTIALPWKTIAKVNATKLLPGQSVGFKRGATWRETLTPGQSGSVGKPVTFGAYGDGSAPAINGSDLVKTWAQTNSAIWSSTVTRQPYAVWFNNVLGTRRATVSSLGTAGDWFWASNILYVYSTTNPTTAYITPGVETAIRQTAGVNGRNYVTLQDIAFNKGGNAPGDTSVYLRQSQNIIMNRCDVVDSVSGGITIANVDGVTGDTLIQYCNFRGTGEAKSGGTVAPSGITTYNTTDSPTFTVEHCTFQDMDAWGAHLGHGIYHQSGKLIWRYNYHYGDRGSTQMGGGAGSAVRLASKGGAQVYNNTFSNDGGRRYWGMAISGGINEIYNNTFSGNNYGIRMAGGTNNISHNIFSGAVTSNWQTNTWYYVYRTGGTYLGDYNQYLGASNGWSWQNDAAVSTTAEWRTASSQDANSVGAK